MAITLTNRLRKLINPKPRGKGRLPPAEDLSALLGGRGIGEPLAAEEGAGGLTPPFTELPNIRTYHPERSYTSSDGFFVLVYQNIESTTFLDNEGVQIPVNYVDEPV